MLQKKIDRAATIISQYPNLLACPKCHMPFDLKAHSITCQKGHMFNLSKKGTLYFLDKKITSEYTKEMLEHRQKMIQSGMYQPMLTAISEQLVQDNAKSILDVGCGEGSFLALLDEMGAPGAKIGFDISKEGVELASNHLVEAMWLVADLTNLPIQKNSITHLLNIFSPSHYHEFERVLTPGGKVLKIIPGADYLKELRERLMAGTERETYSNEKVYNRFKEEMTLVSEKNITYQYTIPKELHEDFLFMSPLSWQATQEQREAILAHPITEITIDVTLLEGIVRN